MRLAVVNRMLRTSLLALLLFTALEARPCSIVVEAHELDPAEKTIDQAKPARPVVEVQGIQRGHAPRQRPGGAVMATSCDDIGIVTLRLTGPAVDDRIPAAKMGYRFVLAEGELPAGMELPAEARRTLILPWVDGATDDQEPLAFALRLIAVDLAGNESEPSELVWVRDPRQHLEKE
jgi:hypothetical protein